jgi:hypothetical protein
MADLRSAGSPFATVFGDVDDVRLPPQSLRSANAVAIASTVRERLAGS